jgi:hypothetical protein
MDQISHPANPQPGAGCTADVHATMPELDIFGDSMGVWRWIVELRPAVDKRDQRDQAWQLNLAKERVQCHLVAQNGARSHPKHQKL